MACWVRIGTAFNWNSYCSLLYNDIAVLARARRFSRNPAAPENRMRQKQVPNCGRRILGLLFEPLFGIFCLARVKYKGMTTVVVVLKTSGTTVSNPGT
jgi:hypothetical protein